MVSSHQTRGLVLAVALAAVSALRVPLSLPVPRRVASLRAGSSGVNVDKLWAGKGPGDESSSELRAVPLELEDDECDIANPTACETDSFSLTTKLNELQEKGFGSVALLGATAVSLLLANSQATSAFWSRVWATPLGPSVAGHALSARAWCNEGLMAVFFFLIGLEIKQELRKGALTSIKAAALPCIAAIGGMVTPMAVYALAQGFLPAASRSLSGLAVPMATDIAFAMAIFGLFRSKMPASSSAFLLTLATVDDLGAIAVLATCFAANISGLYLGAAAGLVGLMGWLGSGPRKCGDARVFTVGGLALWWSLLKAGIGAEVAGVLAALCVSTDATVKGTSDRLANRLIARLSPIATFGIMPIFALANTGVNLGEVASAGAAAGSAPALGIGLGLLLGKPLGIYGFTRGAVKCGLAETPKGMEKSHLAIVSALGAIGFTMCILLTEVAIPKPLQALPKLSVLGASTVATLAAAGLMARLPARPAAAAGSA